MKFRYIGALAPSRPADNFAVSIYQKGKHIFVDVIENGRIEHFKKLRNQDVTVLRLSGVDLPIVEPGYRPIYSFVTHEGDLFFGEFNVIRTKLTPFLAGNEIYPTTKLLISTFLNRHYSTERYLFETRLFFQSLNATFQRNSDAVFNTLVEISEIGELHSYEQLITIEDPEDYVDYFLIVDENGEIPSTDSSTLYLCFKNKKISFSVLEEAVLRSNDFNWLIQFFGKCYYAPNFARILSANDVVYAKLLDFVENIGEEILTKAISPYIRENPAYLEEIKERSSIWRYKSQLESKMHENLERVRDNFSEHEDSIGESLDYDGFLKKFSGIPETINSLL